MLCLYTGNSFPIRYINFKMSFNFNTLSELDRAHLKVLLLSPRKLVVQESRHSNYCHTNISI